MPMIELTHFTDKASAGDYLRSHGFEYIERGLWIKKKGRVCARVTHVPFGARVHYSTL